jgi:hypothetical protein
MIKYLLDENVDRALLDGLHQHYPDLTTWIIGDPATPRRKTPDPDILLWCEASQFILVTNNRSSMPVHLNDHLAADRHVPGIFILNPSMSHGETIDELALICGASEPDEYMDQIRHLPISY